MVANLQSHAIKLWRFVALMLCALTLGMGLCHVMEMPARMSWDQALWIGATVQGGLYRMFGTVGAAIDLAAIASAGILAYLLRDTAEFRLAAIGAGLYLLALIGWLAVVLPANFELARWLTTPPPQDWAATRLQWETGHAINTLFQLVGFGALLWVSLKGDAREARTLHTVIPDVTE
jgi:hypothetical protein